MDLFGSHEYIFILKKNPAIIVISYINNKVLMDFMTYQSSVKYSDVLELELADGLKELLMDYGFTRRRILKIQSDDLASILGIEDYVAKIICNAAKRKP